MIREKIIPVACLVVALFIPCYAISIQSAHADPWVDMSYLTTLDNKQVPYTSARIAIDWAHTVCQGLADGLPQRQVVSTVAAHGLPQSFAETLVQAAVDWYCPKPTVGEAA